MNKIYQNISELPKGEHIVRICAVDIGISKAGAPRVWCPLEIMEGASSGDRFAKVQMLNSPKAIQQCLQDWRNIGIHVSAPDELGLHVEEILGMRIVVNIVHEEKPACYFLRRAPDTPDPPHAIPVDSRGPTPALASLEPEITSVSRSILEIQALLEKLKLVCNRGLSQSFDANSSGSAKDTLTAEVQLETQLQFI